MTRDETTPGPVSVVTGASSGIGRAIALGLAHPGSTVALVGRRLAQLEAVAADIAARGGRPVCLAADLALAEEPGRLGIRIARELGVVDVLVHSAGIFQGEPGESEPGARHRVFQVNVRAPELLTEALLPELRRPRGQLVFINSSAGLPGVHRETAYGESKQALRSLADRLRDRLNPEGIRVLSVYPGRTATPMQVVVCAAEGIPYRPERLLQADDVATMVLQALALPGTAEVTDLSIRPLLPP